MIKWSEKYRVGIDAVDDQHKELFRLTGELSESIDRDAELDKNYLIARLEVYSLYHFTSEEHLMEKYNYPDFEKHKQEHKTFFSEINSFKTKHKEGAPLLARNILLYLSGWFRKHIVENDKKFGKFLEEKNIRVNNL